MSAVQSPKSVLDVNLNLPSKDISQPAQFIKLENLNKKKEDSSKGATALGQLVVTGVNGERRRSLLDSQQRQMQSSRVSNSLLLDDFFSKSRERLTHSGSATPNNAIKIKLSESTATGS